MSDIQDLKHRRGTGDCYEQIVNERKISDTLERELNEARAVNNEMHRRAQAAESIIARSGIVEGRPQDGHKGRSLGRVLANYAAAQYKRERDEARKEVDRLREEIESHSFDLSPAMVQARNDQLNEQLDEARKALLECMEYVWCKDGRCGTRCDETAWPEEYDRWLKAAGLGES